MIVRRVSRSVGNCAFQTSGILTALLQKFHNSAIVGNSMKYITLLVLWFSSLYFLGCERRTETPYFVAITNAPEIEIGPSNTVLNAWYVEDDGFGHRGYACVYGSLSLPHPGGKGLFQSIEALRNEIHLSGHSGMIIESEFRG